MKLTSMVCENVKADLHRLGNGDYEVVISDKIVVPDRWTVRMAVVLKAETWQMVEKLVRFGIETDFPAEEGE